MIRSRRLRKAKQLVYELSAVFSRIYYYGHLYTCPFCHSHLKMLLPYGDDNPFFKKIKAISAGRRFNACCPVCRCSDRERLLYLYLLHKTSTFSKSIKLLHIAPERSLERILKRQNNVEYLTADLCQNDVMVKADLNNLPFQNNSFDAVICNHVLEYIPDDLRAMTEIYRVLKPEGWAILMEQIVLTLDTTYEVSGFLTRADRYRVYGEPDHQRLYGKDYHKRIEKVGFLVDVFQWANEGESFGGHGNKFALLDGENVYIAIKPS
jgi:SAM-dependent methyltransferase